MNHHHNPAERELSIHAVSFAVGGGRRSKRLLTAAQRRRLMALATRFHLAPHMTVFREGAPVSHIFIVGAGLVKSFRELPSGRERIVAFLFPRDVFGLAERGCYVNTTKTVTKSTIYRIPYEALAAALLGDANLQSRFMLKITESLRLSQRQTLVLRRRDAIGRLAMFLTMLEEMLDSQLAAKPRDGMIPLPMSRADIAAYLGLSPEAVNRAARALAQRKIVAFVSLHSAVVMDRARLRSLVAADE